MYCTLYTRLGGRFHQIAKHIASFKVRNHHRETCTLVVFVLSSFIDRLVNDSHRQNTLANIGEKNLLGKQNTPQR